MMKKEGEKEVSHTKDLESTEYKLNCLKAHTVSYLLTFELSYDVQQSFPT